MFWNSKKQTETKGVPAFPRIDPCNHYFIKVATTYVDAPYPLEDM